MRRPNDRIARLSRALRALAGVVAADARSHAGRTDVVAPVNRAIATNVASPGGHRVAVQRQHVTVEQRGATSAPQAPSDDPQGPGQAST